MYVMKVNYTNVDGGITEETLLFHMSTRDWIKADADKKPTGGYDKFIEDNISDEQTDPVKVLTVLEDIVKRSYGFRSEDGKKFIRDPAKTEEFMDSLAYDAFLDDMLIKPGVSQDFIKNVLPKNIDVAKFEESANASGIAP